MPPPRLRAVRTRREFEALSRSRRRGRADGVWVVHADHLDPGDTTVGVAFAIGRPVGSAVVRNRLRRRLRALMHQRAAADVRGLYLIGAAPDVPGLTFVELADRLDRALERLP